MNNTSVKEQIQELLLKLGTTKEEIFKSLKKQGIKGKKKGVNSCPIANYLKFNLSAPYRDELCVGFNNIWLNEDEFIPLGICTEFIFDFDRGKFWQLDEETSFFDHLLKKIF